MESGPTSGHGTAAYACARAIQKLQHLTLAAFFLVLGLKKAHL